MYPKLQHYCGKSACATTAGSHMTCLYEMRQLSRRELRERATVKKSWAWQSPGPSGCWAFVRGDHE